MRASQDIAELAAALAKFQKAMPTVPKTHTARVPTKSGGEYTYHYADLADTMEAASSHLEANGLSVTQGPSYEEGVGDVLTTRVMHASGQWIESTMRLFLAKEDPQSHGSALTYARRYALCAALGIVADEDDDGAVATHAKPPRAKPARSEATSEEPSRREQHSTVRRAPQTPRQAQMALMVKLFEKAELADATERLRYASNVIGRELAKASEMTDEEAEQVVKNLQMMVEAD